jgi:hypothetical protein
MIYEITEYKTTFGDEMTQIILHAKNKNLKTIIINLENKQIKCFANISKDKIYINMIKKETYKIEFNSFIKYIESC